MFELNGAEPAKSGVWSSPDRSRRYSRVHMRRASRLLAMGSNSWFEHLGYEPVDTVGGQRPPVGRRGCARRGLSGWLTSN